MINQTIRIALIVVANSTALMNLNGQCISTGAHSPTTITNDASIGTLPWLNFNDVVSSNGVRATATSTAIVLGGQQSNYLKTTGYGFSIPLTATVCGISVEFEKSASAFLLPTAYVEDLSVNIVKGGIIYPTSLAQGANWTSTDTYYTHGNGGEAWGTTWTPAEINASDFGVAISARIVSILSFFPTARIDHVRVTVHYDDSPLPIELLNFNGLRLGATEVKLNWESTAHQKENDLYFIERSFDGSSFEELGQHKGIGNGLSNMEYIFVDNQASEKACYYRIKQLDVNGNFEYSQSLMIPAKGLADVHLYPIPAKGSFTIQSLETISSLVITTAYGKVVYESIVNAKIAEVELKDIPKEVYFVKMYLPSQVVMKKVLFE